MALGGLGFAAFGGGWLALRHGRSVSRGVEKAEGADDVRCAWANAWPLDVKPSTSETATGTARPRRREDDMD
jgi:hypothetical protein